MKPKVLSGPVRTGLSFEKIVLDLREYFEDRKHSGLGDVHLSQKSWELMQGWSRRPVRKRPEPAFLFEGSKTAQLMLVDSRGLFFKGESGALLKKILKAMHLSQGNVFICNADALEPVCKAVETVQPAVIVTLGQKASTLLLNETREVEELCGRFHSFMGIKVMPSFHPSRLIRNSGLKRQVWEDMKQVMTVLESAP